MAVIMKIREVDGFYGRHDPCESTIFVADMSDGTTWYAVEGGTMAYQTEESIEDGVNVEDVNDIDIFSIMGGIDTLEDFERYVEE